jgi:hypothetical protein
MKNFFQMAMMAGLLGLGSSAATAAQKPDDAAGAQATVETGSLIYAELSKTVDSKKAKAGDPVTALLLADVVSHGKIVVRRETKLVGHVTEAQPRSKENPESRLGIIFDKFIVKGGQEIPFRSVLMGLGPAPRPVFDVPSAPSPPGTNPASGPPPDKHYPSPKPNTPRMSSDKLDSGVRAGMKAHEEEMSGVGATDIDGLSLTAPKNGVRAIVSLERTVKLESGVRIDLRVIGTAP